MSDVAVKVEGLGKRYLIQHEAQRGEKTFREMIMEGVSSLNPLAMSKRKKAQAEEFWALQDINFEIKKGDKVGIIGRNGAGKSTLLKVLSRITEPTTGKIHINGRIASLLEVGTGFHPELTGRENIFLNGAILGMSRQEIKAKFDEIVAFYEVEKFLDTPVKRYSSGMYVRLAFAVAAHLEPEILVVDEVLAVGDAAFQRKCLGKMNEVSQEGRTVLFVSHNMNAIEQLCNSAILLEHGKIKSFCSANTAIQEYTQNLVSTNHIYLGPKDTKLPEYIQPIKICLLDSSGTPLHSINRLVCKNATVSIQFQTFQEIEDLTIGYRLYDSQMQAVYRSLNTDNNTINKVVFKKGIYTLRSELPLELLNEGHYTLILDDGIYTRRWLFNPEQDTTASISFEISNKFSTSVYWQDKRDGIVAPTLEWTLHNESI